MPVINPRIELDKMKRKKENRNKIESNLKLLFFLK